MYNISLVGSCNFRTFFYLKALKNANIQLKELLIYDYKKLNFKKFLNNSITYKGYEIRIDESLDSLLKYYNAKVIDETSINRLEKFIQNNTSDFFIFSGKGGEIVKGNILKLTNFLHIHPGKLPSYRGSTTIYYSLLKESKCFASAFFLDKKIDTGKVIKEMQFDILDIDFDYIYDPFIRSYLLIDILKNTDLTSIEQDDFNAKEYYIIHPILKKLALQKKESIIQNEKNL